MSQAPTFYWENETQTNSLSIDSIKYQIEISPSDNFLIVTLKENGKELEKMRTSSNNFKEVVTETLSLKEQVLEWGIKLINENLHLCDHCHEKKYTKALESYDKEEEFLKSYNRLCPSCRVKLYNEMYSHLQEERNAEDDAFKKGLEENPPILIGGFKAEKEAERILKAYSNSDIEDVGDGFVIAKGIIKANDGTFYPVFIHICSQDGGELYGLDFIDSKNNQLIPQQFIFPFIKKEKEDIFPYKYKTLSRLPGDFHQSEWPNFS